MAYITQCPHCQTRFRLTDAHLDAYGGQVRCGKCQQVFDARQSLKSDSVVSTPAPTPEPAPAPSPRPAPTPQPDSVLPPADSANMAREAEHLAKVLADAEKARQALNQKPAKLTADDQPAVGKPVLPSDQDIDRFNAEFDLTLPEFDMLPDVGKPAAAAAPAPVATPAPVAPPPPAAAPPVPPPPPPPAPAPVAPPPPVVEPEPVAAKPAPAPAAAFDQRLEPSFGDSFNAALGKNPEMAPMAPIIPFDDEDDDDAKVSLSSQANAQSSRRHPNREEIIDEPPPPDNLDSFPFGHPAFTADPFAEIPPPPLTKKKSQSAALSWLWLGSSMVATAALMAQMAYLYRTELGAEVPGARPVLESLCSGFGCDVPLPQKAEFLRTEWSELTFVPDHPNLVQLSATLRNHAPYPQSYPHLEVSLKDGEDHLLARRVFTPEQYLSETDFKLQQFNGSSEVKVLMHLDLGQLKSSGYSLLWFYP